MTSCWPPAPRYRALLSGLDEATRRAAGDRIEALADLVTAENRSPRPAAPGTSDRAVTAAAWQPSRQDSTARRGLLRRPEPGGRPRRHPRWRGRLAAVAGPDTGAAGQGGGAAGGAGRGPRRRGHRGPAHRPRHAAQRAAGVPPATAHRPGTGRPRRAHRPGRPDPGAYRARRRCRRRLPNRAVLGDRRVPGDQRRRVRQPDRRNLRHRAGRGAHHALATGPDLGPTATPLAGLLRTRDGRPDHDPDDDRRRPVRIADRERPAQRPGRPGHLRRRRRRAAPGQPGARPVDADGDHPAGRRHGGVPTQVGPSLRDRPRPDRDRQRRVPGEPLRDPRSTGVRPRTGHPRPLPRAGPAVPAGRGSARSA